MHSTPASRPLINILNRTGPRSKPQGTPLVTGHQPDVASLATALWTLQPVLHPEVCLHSGHTELACMHQRWQNTAPLTNLTLRLLSLPTSSCSSATNQRSSSIWSHLPQTCLQSLSTSRNIHSHIPQLETWAVTRLNGSSICAAALVLPGTRSSGEIDNTTFCQVVIMLPHTSLLGNIYALPLQSAGLIVLACLNLPCWLVQVLPLAVSSNQGVSCWGNVPCSAKPLLVHFYPHASRHFLLPPLLVLLALLWHPLQSATLLWLKCFYIEQFMLLLYLSS